MTSKLLLRVDGSAQTGMGHVMRCLALSEALAQTGIDPIFVTHDADLAALKALKEAGKTVVPLPCGPASAQDAAETARAAKESGARGVVIDLNYEAAGIAPEAARDYLQSLRRAFPMLAAIDGLGQTEFPYDLLAVPFVGADILGLRFNPRTQILQGARYFVARSEFARAATAPRSAPPVARNVLVTMGGSDPAKLTELALTACAAPGSKRRLRVVLGQAFGDARTEALRAACAQASAEAVVGASMAEMMSWADVAVIAGGLTKYEAAIAGVPALALSQNPREVQLTEEFSRLGSLVHLGLGTALEPQELARRLYTLNGDPERRSAMSEAGRRLVDGKGAQRLADALAQLLIPRDRGVAR